MLLLRSSCVTVAAINCVVVVVVMLLPMLLWSFCVVVVLHSNTINVWKHSMFTPSELTGDHGLCLDHLLDTV